MTIRYASAVKTARLTTTKDQLLTGTGTAYLKIYSGAAPADHGAVTYQELLCRVPITTATVADGYITLTLPAATVEASGRAGWARMENREAAVIADLDVGLTGSAADMTLATLDLVTGATLTPTLARIGEL